MKKKAKTSKVILAILCVVAMFVCGVLAVKFLREAQYGLMAAMLVIIVVLIRAVFKEINDPDFYVSDEVKEEDTEEEEMIDEDIASEFDEDTDESDEDTEESGEESGEDTGEDTSDEEKAVDTEE